MSELLSPVRSGRLYAGAKWKAMAGHALSWEACLWSLVAAILAATMGMWPPHLYL